MSKFINSMRNMQARPRSGYKSPTVPTLVIQTPEELGRVFDLARMNAPWEDIVFLVTRDRARAAVRSILESE